jgi:hypothetical protein
MESNFRAVYRIGLIRERFALTKNERPRDRHVMLAASVADFAIQTLRDLVARTIVS